MTLLERLISIQHDLGFSDEQFARRLGISRPLWTLTKSGRRNIRFELLSRAIASFPENAALRAAVLTYLETEGREPASVA